MCNSSSHLISVLPKVLLLIFVRTFIKVDLPAPFGPITPNISPYCKPNETFYNTYASSYFLYI